MNKPFDSGPVRLGCYPLSRLDVNGMKSLLSALEVKADRIYNAAGNSVDYASPDRAGSAEAGEAI